VSALTLIASALSHPPHIWLEILLEQLNVKIPVAELFGKLKVLVLFVLFGSVHLSLLLEFT
jgi:hypothetical protein